MIDYFDVQIAYHQGAYDVILSLLDDKPSEKSMTPTTRDNLRMNLEWHLGLLHLYQERKRRYEGADY